jgi:hypothetical protein
MFFAFQLGGALAQSTVLRPKAFPADAERAAIAPKVRAETPDCLDKRAILNCNTRCVLEMNVQGEWSWIWVSKSARKRASSRQ